MKNKQIIKVWKFLFLVFVFNPVFCSETFAQPIKQGDEIPFSVTFSSEKQSPAEVPIVPILSQINPYFFGGLDTKPATNDDYQPSGDGAFIKVNGKSELRYSQTSGTGVWRLLVGDKPVVGLAFRSTTGAYAAPGIMSNLGITGKIQLTVSNGKIKKNLENFTKITAILSAGEPHWLCEDSDLKVKILLTAHVFLDDYACALVAKIESQKLTHINLEWKYEDARFVKDEKNYAEFACNKYTRIFAGSTAQNSMCRQGVTSRTIDVSPGKPGSDTYVCLWGYSDYDKDEIDAAYSRLRFRPFPSEEWVLQMRKDWFHHWIGRGLEPEKKFIALLKNSDLPISQSKEFWESMRKKVVIKTGDARFDNVVQSIGARLISNYEYPGYLHGSNFMKYGKINCGMYGHEAAGFHEEVASSLQFLAGTQCVKGRQRYIMPNFRISEWAEEMNPYFIEQVWYHYRWTGDLAFLNIMWPSVRKALEHLIATSDPEHDGIFTGYYENWNGDGKDRGGKSSLWTAMGISALRCGYNISKLLADTDFESKGQVSKKQEDGDFSRRYKRLLDKAEASYKTLYNKRIGAYSSGEWNAALRNKPDNEESNYAIWREVGGILENYTSLRYIRDNYHEKSQNGAFIEFGNRNWPVHWSNHYDSFADAMASIASSAMTNDINNYWPLLKSVSEGVYTKPECTVIAGGSSVLSLESDQMFMMAVLDNIFGIKPYFGDHLLRIRPSFPDSWVNPEIDIPDVSYKYLINKNEICLNVKTPVQRKLQAEIPVKRSVKEVLLNGEKVSYEIKKEVNFCRVIVVSEAAKEHNIKVITEETKDAIIEGDLNCIIGKPAIFNIINADLVSIQNPQIDFAQVDKQSNSVQIIPKTTGNFTLFAELKSGNISWYHPLELSVKEPWSITARYKAWTEGKPAKLLSPFINKERQSLQFEMVNNSNTKLEGKMAVNCCGQTVTKKVSLPAMNSTKLEISLKDVWDNQSPGTLDFTVVFNGEEKKSHAIDWEIGKKNLTGRLNAINILKYNNIKIKELYGESNAGQLKWRNDYTGAAVGVDWRENLQIDSLGFMLFVPPTSLMGYGTLPEQYSPPWWSTENIPDTLGIPIPFPYIERNPVKNNILALINTQNTKSIPGQAVIELKNPIAAEKLYFLTANLTKTCKSYYPAAEIEIIYDSGEKQLTQLIPPFNMPSVMQPFCPEAVAIPLGQIKNNQTFHSNEPGLSLTDLTTDPTRKIKKVLVRCFSTETVFGILGISFLTKK